MVLHMLEELCLGLCIAILRCRKHAQLSFSDTVADWGLTDSKAPGGARF